MSNLKKLLYVGATASLVLWSVATALPVSAATIASGDLVKTASSSAVYYIQGATKRVFPHANVFSSWGYTNYNGVKVVSASDLAAYADGNPMPFRDGSLFRGTSSGLGGYAKEAVYYVQDGKIRPVKSSEIYQALFKDSSWTKVTWVPDDLLDKFNYTVGTMVESSSTHPDGSLVKYTGGTTKYLISGGSKRAFASDAAFTANRYRTADVITIDASEVYADGTAINGEETGLLTPGWVGTTTSGLTVALYNTPVATTLPKGATNAGLVKFNLTAGASAVTVTGLTFWRTGVGATTDWSDLYLYEGDTRITAIGRTLNSDSHTVEFPALSISVPANSYKTITLRGDLLCTGTACVTTSATAGAEHVFKVTAVTTSATVTGLPIAGNKMTVGSSAVGTATISRGSIPANPTVGAKETEVLQFKIQNTSSNNDITFDQVVFTYSGTMSRSYLTNLKLSLLGETTALASTAALNSNDTVTLTLATPYTVAKGITKTFSVKADLGGKAAETLALYMDQANHLVVTDKQYGTGAKVTIDTTIDGAADTQLTLQGGTIAIADNGPVAGKIGKNQNDLVLTKFSMTSARDVEVRRLSVTLTTSDAGAVSNADSDISDLRIKDLDTGATVASTSVNTDATWDSAYTLTNTFNLNAGVTRNFAITVDIGADADLDFSDMHIGANLAMVTYGTTQVYIYDPGTGQYLEASSIAPSSVTGDYQQIIVAALSTTLASTPVNQNVVKGATNVETVGVVFAAGDASNAVVRQVQVRVYVNSAVDFGAGTDDETPNGEVTAVRLYNGATPLGTKTLTNTSGTHYYGLATFDGLTNVTVPKGTSSTKLTVKLDLSSGISSTTYIAASVLGAGITAYDGDGNSVTVSTNANAVTAGATPDRYATVTTGGSLNIAADPDTPTSDVIVANTSNVNVAKFKFTATKENWTVNKLKLELNTAANEGSVSAVKLSYPGGSATGYLSTSGGVSSVTFNGLNWTVEADTYETLSVNTDLKAVDPNIDETGREIRLNIACATANECEAVGTSQTVLGDANDELADANGNAMYLRKSKPTVSLVTLSSTLLSDGSMTLFKFNVAADSAGSITLKKVAFDVTPNDAGTGGALTLNTWKLYDSTDLSNAIAGTWTDGSSSSSSGAIAVTASKQMGFELDTEKEIAGGASKTYLVKTTVSNSTQYDSVICRLSATNDTSANFITGGLIDDTTGFDLVKLDNASTTKSVDFLWSDKAEGVNHTESYQNTYKDYTSGYLIDILPSEYQTLTR